MRLFFIWQLLTCNSHGHQGSQRPYPGFRDSRWLLERLNDTRMATLVGFFLRQCGFPIVDFLCFRVACGIMIGFVVNFIIAAGTTTLEGDPNTQLNIHDGRYHALQWIAAAPAVPSLLLLIAVCYCYESPRFYMRPGTPNYNLSRAFDILLQVRKTRVISVL